MNKTHLDVITIKNFKSIKYSQITLHQINVLIGGNGVGKSNFINVFKLMNSIISKHLQVFLRNQGIDTLLHFGRNTSETVSLDFKFGQNKYGLELIESEDTLVFNNEYFSFKDIPHNLGKGHLESRFDIDISKSKIPLFIISALRSWKTYHFHNTGELSALKTKCKITDNKFFKENGSNLPAFLLHLKQKYPSHYNDIVSCIKRIMPTFDDFYLKEDINDPTYISLNWKEVNQDNIFSVHQLSDGTIRFIAMATLFLQPEELMPSTFILDEPELGLHPAAILMLAELIKMAGQYTQIIISTQSVELLNEFLIEDIIVVSRDETGTIFSRLSEEDFKEWLEEDYAVGDLWKKNIIGGRP